MDYDEPCKLCNGIYKNMMNLTKGWNKKEDRI